MAKNTRQDLATAGALFAFFLAVLFLGIGCADSPAAPTPAAIAVEPSRSRGATESAPSSYLGDAGSIPAGISNITPETLTLTVTPDGERDRVRASDWRDRWGLVLPRLPAREDAAEPTERPRRAVHYRPVRPDRIVGLVGARGFAPSRPARGAAAMASTSACGWSTTAGGSRTRATHGRRTGARDYQVCAP